MTAPRPLADWAVVITFPSGKRQTYRDSGLEAYSRATAEWLAKLLRNKFARQGRALTVTVEKVAP